MGTLLWYNRERGDEADDDLHLTITHLPRENR